MQLLLLRKRTVGSRKGMRGLQSLSAVYGINIRTENSALSAILNSPLSSTSQVPKWLLAQQPVRITANHIKSEEKVVADKVSRIPWPVAVPKAVEIVPLTGQIALDSDREHES